MKLNGFSNYELANILSKLILFITLVMIVLKFIISPLAVEYRSKIEHQITHEQKIYSLKEGNFNISNDKSKVVYINNKETSEPANIFIKSYSNSTTRIDISSAVTSESNNSNLISLDDGVSYIFNPDGSFSSTKYITQDMILADKIPQYHNSDIEAMSMAELFGLDDVSAHREIFKRLSLIISSLVLGYLAIPLSNYANRNDKYRNIFLGIIIYFSYIIFINLISASTSDVLDLILSAFLLHSTYIYLMLFFYKNTTRSII